MSGITAILPAFNEEVAIGSVVLETRALCELSDFSVPKQFNPRGIPEIEII